jgi:site-specific recombinase XerD
MSPKLAEDLRTYCLNGRRICKSSPDKVKLVFCDERGEPISPDKARVEFHELLEKAGVRRCRLQDCRHTMASILLNAGVSIFYVPEAAWAF